MSGSGSRRLSAAGLAIVAGVTLASGAMGQEPGTPAASPLGVGAPIRLGPPVRAGTPEPEPTFRSEFLAPPSPESVGILAPGAEGLPEPVWDGTRRALLERLLPLLPERNPSPILRGLERRLLLTSAEPPQGDGPSLVALRIAKLGAMGATVDAVALAEAASMAGDSESARLRFRAHLLAGTYDAACDGIPGLGEPDALKLTAFCQALDGRIDAALLTAGLLREAGGGDPVFVTLLDAATGSRTDLPHLSDFAPEHLALLRLVKLPVPAEASDVDAPDVLAALAVEPLADPALRVEAAERVATLGLLDAGALAAVYEATSADTARGAIAQRLAAGAPPEERGSLVAEATAGMSVQRLAGPVGTFWADALRPADARSASAAVAERLARLLLAQGRGAEAAPWLDVLASLDGAAASMLYPASVAAGVRPTDGAGLEGWIGRLRAGDGAALRRAAGILAVLRAGGAAIPDEAWLAVLDTGRTGHEMPSPALVQWLRDAALAGVVGETVLVALALMQEEAPADAAPMVVAAVVEALRAVGLDTEARRIAIEAVLPPAE